MIEWGIPAERIVVCDNGTESLGYTRRGGRGPGEPLRIAYLGSGSLLKGLPVLLEAFRGMIDAELVIWGPKASEIPEDLHAVLEQENVHLAGTIDDEQKAHLLPEVDALVVPSIWYENSPLVIHEAFAAGVPVICSNIGGMAELVTDGVDGLHFPVGEAAALRRVLERCIKEPQLLDRLRAGVKQPKSMHYHVHNEILPLYERLLREQQITRKESRAATV